MRCLSLSPGQCSALIEDHHVYLPENGRINIAGLSLRNIEWTARAIDSVIRELPGINGSHMYVDGNNP